jgi:hypothetical protein
VANDIITGYLQSYESTGISVAPNPVVSDIRVSMPAIDGDYARYDIFDPSGRKMAISGSVTGFNITDIVIGSAESLTPGIYILRLTTQNKTFAAKFIKR